MSEQIDHHEGSLADFWLGSAAFVLGALRKLQIDARLVETGSELDGVMEHVGAYFPSITAMGVGMIGIASGLKLNQWQ